MSDKNNAIKRAKNWTIEEEDVLVSECALKNNILYGKLSPCLTSQDKKRTWVEIAEKVSSLGTIRSPDDCRIKHCKIKSEAKKKAAANASARAQTGGGPFSEKTLSAAEEKAVALVPEVLIQGIPETEEDLHFPECHKTTLDEEIKDENHYSAASKTNDGVLPKPCLDVKSFQDGRLSSELRKRRSVDSQGLETSKIQRTDLQENYVKNMEAFTSTILALVEQQNEYLRSLSTSLEALNANIATYIVYVSERNS